MIPSHSIWIPPSVFQPRFTLFCGQNLSLLVFYICEYLIEFQERARGACFARRNRLKGFSAIQIYSIQCFWYQVIEQNRVLGFNCIWSAVNWNIVENLSLIDDKRKKRWNQKVKEYFMNTFCLMAFTTSVSILIISWRCRVDSIGTYL